MGDCSSGGLPEADRLDYPFRSLSSLLDSNVFRVPRLGQHSEHGSPRRLLMSKSAKTISAVREPRVSQTNISGSQSLNSSPQKLHKFSFEHDHPSDTISSITRPAPRERSSVADLRNSFEQMARQPQEHVVLRTPAKQKNRLSTTIVQSPSRCVDQALHNEEVKGKIVEEILPHTVVGPLNLIDEASMLKECEMAIKEIETPPQTVKEEFGPFGCTSTSLPSSKSPRSQFALMLKPKTFEAPSRPAVASEAHVGPVLADRGPDLFHKKTGEDLKSFPYSSPIHPLLLCGSDQRGSGKTIRPDKLEHYPLENPSSSKQIKPSRCPSKQTDLSSPSANHVTENDGQPTHRQSKVADLRRLFDRSSSGSFMSFTRRQRQTSPHVEWAGSSHHSPGDFGSAVSEPSSPSSCKTASPPALTTVISVNDFACTFMDGSLQPSHSFSTTRSHFHLGSDSPPLVTHESPLKDRINHFEHLSSRTRSHDTDAQSEAQANLLDSQHDMPTAVMPKATENRHPVRSVWRRLSQTLTHFSDGSHYTQEHYRSSYQGSSTSVDQSRSPPCRAVFPLLPARKSFPFMHRFSSSGTDDHIFGLDGANQSLPHVPDADVFTSAPPVTISDQPTNAPPSLNGKSKQTGHECKLRPALNDGQRRNDGLLPRSSLMREVSQQDRARRKEEKKLERQAAREQRRKRIADRRYGKSPAAKAAPDPKVEERTWEKQTASGFVVRQARLPSDDLAAPKPRRPGQVKKVLNYSKEKSTSLLRIVSGGHYGNSKEQLDDSNQGPATPESLKGLWKRKGKGREKAEPSTTYIR